MHIIPTLRPFVQLTWLAATAAILLAGCRKSDASQPLVASPEKVVLIEQSADLRAWINAELAAGKRRIVIPPGRYRVPSEQGYHLQFKNLTNVEIIATHVEMVCTSTVQAVLFDHCSNVTLRGLVVDYDPLPFTQGEIIAMAPDKSSMDFEVAGGYPENKLVERVQIYDPATGELRRGDANWKQEIQALGGRRYRVGKDRYRFDPLHDTEQVGDILVTNHSFGTPGSPHAVELKDSKGVLLEDITVFASPCFGFLEYDCDGIRYIRCKVDRRDPADDPVVKDCDFGHNRSRGILIKASKGEVSGNRIVKSRMAAVLISPEFWWMEAGTSSDLVIRDNFIEGCLQTPIQILAPGGDGRPLPSGAHRNISVLNNRMADCPWPLIRVTSTSGLVLKDNEYPEAPPTWQSASSGGRKLVAIDLEQCEGVESNK